MTEYAWIDANNNVRLKGTPDPAISASTPGAARVIGPFPFAYNTASINNGVTIWTPAIGDVLVDAWVEIDTLFNGTTPFADIGTFVDTTAGFWGNYGYAIDLTGADSQATGTGYLNHIDSSPATGAYASPLSAFDAFTSSTPASIWTRSAPGVFKAANPLKVVVSQDGTIGGTAVGGTTGSANAYLIVATPSLT